MWHTARHDSPNTTKKNSPHHDQENGGGCFNGAGAERRRGVVHVRAVVTGRVGRRVLRGGRKGKRAGWRVVSEIVAGVLRLVDVHIRAVRQVWSNAGGEKMQATEAHAISLSFGRERDLDNFSIRALWKERTGACPLSMLLGTKRNRRVEQEQCDHEGVCRPWALQGD